MEKTRLELFDLVWQMPIIHLSKQLNVSDVGLRKICVRHDIPLPARGHWTKKDLGQADAPPELPNRDHNPSIEFPNEAQAAVNEQIAETKKAIKKLAIEPVEFTRTIDTLRDPRCIRTAESINAHIRELEKSTQLSFDAFKSKPSSWPPTNPFAFAYFRPSKEEIPITATAKHALRAICIADEIIERLKAFGIEVVLEEYRNYWRYQMTAKKDTASYEFEFRETWTKMTRTPALTKLEKLTTGREGWRDYLEVPKNQLSILLGGSYSGKAIRDTGLKLENQIDKIVQYIVDKIEASIQHHIEREIQEREYERKKAIRQYNERIVADQERQLELAMKDCDRYFELKKFEEYLLLMQDAISRLPDQQRTIGMAWLALVRKKQAALNPIEKRIKKFKSINKHGTKKSEQFWFAKPIEEEYDPDFEEEYSDDNLYGWG